MPELPEVEVYRAAAEQVIGRTVCAVEVRDPRFVRGAVTPDQLAAQLVGRMVLAARRRGKLLVLDLAPAPSAGHRVAVHPAAGRPAAGRPAAGRPAAGRPAGCTPAVGDPAAVDPTGGPRLGLRFGMTGRLLVDGAGPIDRLLYSSDRAEPRWDRLVVRFGGGGELVVRDPRLLGGAVLDPDEQALGPDALSVTLAQLRRALDASAVALKARLLDQARVAGIGNLVADELLWRAGLRPERPAGSLDEAELRRLARAIPATLRVLLRRGGSHTGDLMPARVPGGRCPRDGADLRRCTVGGRTTWWCPKHQR